MNAVDTYVIYDDVNYINRGWINRNRILINGEPSYLTLPLVGASQNRHINEISIVGDQKPFTKMLRTIECAYARTPNFDSVFPLIEEIILYENRNLAEYIYHSFLRINQYIGINTELIRSSDIRMRDDIKGQNRVLEICRQLNAAEYYNAIGGMQLYDQQTFKADGISLYFLKSMLPPYKQFGGAFVEGLSIIDIMMFNSVEQIHEMLQKYSLLV